MPSVEYRHSLSICPALSSSDLSKILIPMRLNLIPLCPKNLRERCSKIVWRNLAHQQKPAAVCFDLDSTLVQEETIDEFARFLGKDLSAITRQTMDGTLPSFRQSILRRLSLLAPKKAQFDQFVTHFEPKLTEGAEELVKALGEAGIEVFIVTGGFWEVAERVGRRLHIPSKNIFANRIKFDAAEAYRGIDKSQLTSESGPAPAGKGGVCQLLKDRNDSGRMVVMVGDGSTDMEARPPADLFIGFGANQVREKVFQGSDWFVRDFHTLTKCLRDSGGIYRKS